MWKVAAGGLKKIYRIYLFALLSGLGLLSCVSGINTPSDSTTPTANATPAPQLSMTATPASLPTGGITEVSWTSSHATHCTLSGAGDVDTTGHFTTPALTATTTYTLSCTGAGGTTSLSTTVTVSTSTACATTGDINAIVLSHAPSRTRGVAPLSVFFDATATTANATTRPLHDLDYRWNFGDALGSPVKGTLWHTGSKAEANSRNQATGPVAAHVFERAGTYTVALEITDGPHHVSNRCIDIVVESPDTVFSGANTICIASNAVPTAGQDGCPAGAVTAQQPSFPDAIGRYATTGKRVLFKRGDTFTSDNEANITATGPGIIGAYGDAAQPAPLVNTASAIVVLVLSSRGTPGFSDWRIMDMTYTDTLGHLNGGGISAQGGITQITALRLTMSNFETSIGFGGDLINWWNNSGSTGHTVDQLSVVDCVVNPGPNTAYSGYNAGNRIAFMGNAFDNGGIQQRQDTLGNEITNPNGSSNGSHILRFPYLNKAVISNNSLSRPGFNRLAIKLHGPTWVNGVPDAGQKSNYSAYFAGDGYSQKIVIADNKFTDHLNPWAIGLGPQDSGSDERVRDVIVERNWFVATETSQSFVNVWATETTVRNNIFAAGGANASGVSVRRQGLEPPPAHVRIYHNSLFTSYGVAANEVIPFSIGSAASDVTLKNNLAYAPNASSVSTTISGNGGLTATHNTSDAQLRETSPLFATNPPFDPADFKPLTNSYAIGGGDATVPVWSDFFLTPRTGAYDMGAVHH